MHHTLCGLAALLICRIWHLTSHRITCHASHIRSPNAAQCSTHTRCTHTHFHWNTHYTSISQSSLFLTPGRMTFATGLSRLIQRRSKCLNKASCLMKFPFQCFGLTPCWPWRFCHSWLLLLESPFQWTLTVLALSLGVLALRFYKDWCGAAQSVRNRTFFPWRLSADTIIDHWVCWLKDPHPHWYWLLWQQSLWQGHGKKLSKHGFSSCKLDLLEDTNWDPEKRTFFLNEIECRRKQNTHAKFSTENRMIGRYGGTTYFIRHLKEDFVPKTLGCMQWEMGRKEMGMKWDECLFRVFVFGMSGYFGLVSQ